MNIDKIAKERGWVNLGENKMKSMLSYYKGTIRMNYYTTTGSLTFQNTMKVYDKGKSFGAITTDELLIKILDENKL